MNQKVYSATRPQGRKPVYQQSLRPLILFLGTAGLIGLVWWLFKHRIL